MATSALSAPPPAPSRAAAEAAVLVLYHGIESADAPAGNRFGLPLARWAEHLRQIQASGLPCLDLPAWWAATERARPVAEGGGTGVLLCFDDGARSDYEQAFPGLARLGLRAVFFVNTARIGRAGYLTWSQMREMQRAGMSFQSHSHEHNVLTRLPPAQLQRQLRISRHILQERLGSPVHFLAAPYGLWSRTVMEAALLAGYRALCISRPGMARAGATILPRNAVRRGTSAIQLQRWLRCYPGSYAWRRSRDWLLRAPKQLLLLCPSWWLRLTAAEQDPGPFLTAPESRS
jgi:peptidoglycan/xylan/chitin deacetylase (PgdA/CDA1 family)